ncbi:MAG: phenylalanine 4-monooxygenase [Flavobacteriales bacterium]|nr:phenylalanine 4-monooxygenase [Flavobacteriales bacterium]
MKQVYSNYTEQDHKVWSILFARQEDNLQSKCCTTYLQCLENLYPELNQFKLPDYNDLNKRLMQYTGWSIEVVPGLIPVEDFFLLLSDRKFSASTWIRKMNELDYLEKPDMFHDIFGHIPMIAHPKFAQFMEDFGNLGVEHIENKEIVVQLQRLYWFTIEFGLINQGGDRKVYGAGICSSFGETNHALSKEVEVIPFNLEEVIRTEFRTDVIQTKYFELESFDQLFEAFYSFEKKLQQEAVLK